MTTQHPFRIWRRSRNLTLEVCAGVLGVTFQHLGKVETRKVDPSVALIGRMADYSKGAVTKAEIVAFHTEQTGCVSLSGCSALAAGRD